MFNISFKSECLKCFYGSCLEYIGFFYIGVLLGVIFLFGREVVVLFGLVC